MSHDVVTCRWHYYYTCRVKEAIHVRIHPNNINRDSGIEPWMSTIKKNTTTGESCNSRLPREQITEWSARIKMHQSELFEKQLITAEHHALWDHTWPVDLIAWRRLAVCSWNVTIYITRDYIVRQMKKLAFIIIDSQGKKWALTKAYKFTLKTEKLFWTLELAIFTLFHVSKLVLVQ